MMMMMEIVVTVGGWVSRVLNQSWEGTLQVGVLVVVCSHQELIEPIVRPSVDERAKDHARIVWRNDVPL